VRALPKRAIQGWLCDIMWSPKTGESRFRIVLTPPFLPTSNSVTLDVVEQFATYDDYLDSQVTETDMYFLEVRPRHHPACENGEALPRSHRHRVDSL
jgi:hypothetical protein